MKSVLLRDMTPRDLLVVHTIEKACFSSPWTEDAISSEVHSQSAITRIAEVNGEVAGYLIARQVIDEGHLLDMAVDERFRRMGIGEYLLRDLADRLKQNSCEKLYLEVRFSNTAAIGLYEKMGFTNIGLRKLYYKNPAEDAVVMKLNF